MNEWLNCYLFDNNNQDNLCFVIMEQTMGNEIRMPQRRKFESPSNIASEILSGLQQIIELYKQRKQYGKGKKVRQP
jgi:hypothetical protein